MELGTGSHAQVVALVPAHNEEAALPAALDSLWQQTRRPDRVIVIADNCTDRTVDVARAAGAEVFETVANTHKKAPAASTRRSPYCWNCWRRRIASW
ncbi:glycosyltransferase [Kribbella solani]|uniref:glycosyltransferase n=1 Tax=Kribbella solani TaxID=236067 RepID=UPI0029B61F96|nr:glycosyltransferase [Kribbella solani]MDX3003949.1 glycosyltransferase [Kribbella solani]